MIHWSINLSMLFNEKRFLARFQAAVEAGFGAVEFHWPQGIDLEALVRARQEAGVEVALFNMDGGDLARGERGFPNDPQRIGWWRERAQAAFALADRLEARRINVLAGNRIPGLSRDQMVACLIDNLAWALPFAEAGGFHLLLEPLNPFSNPRYLLESTADAVAIIEQLRSPYLKLQFDVFHAQRTEGNLVYLLSKHAARMGHIQIADSPDRHQPGTGEINWKFIFAHLETLDYKGFIGLEYLPEPDTLQSLDWLPHTHRRSCKAEDVTV